MSTINLVHFLTCTGKFVCIYNKTTRRNNVFYIKLCNGYVNLCIFFHNSTRRPAEVVFKEKSQEETQQSRPVQMSESELRRTADKIYHMIEDRIRRERRLLGL